MIDIIVPQRRNEATHQLFEIANRCEQLAVKLADLGIRFHRDSSLGKILRDAKIACQGPSHEKFVFSSRQYINLAYASRIATSMLAAVDDPGAIECLRRIALKPMASLDRSESRGKDALWELELANKMKLDGISLKHEEPDLTIDVGFGSYGVACKKIYSENGVEAQVKKGAKQLKKVGLPGIVALSLDELIAKDVVIRGSSTGSNILYIDRFHNEFLLRHSVKFTRLVDKGLIDGILLSTQVFTSNKDVNFRINNHSQSLLWGEGNLNLSQINRMAALYNARRK